ncbi:MAG: hypothetical protein M0Q38_10510 [Bacteroidales bacterium]|jgi:hypothetical protein|nr:hypothetical protein [Bacteroidales bacterium]
MGKGEVKGYRIQDTGCRIQDTGCRIQDTGCRMQDAGCRKQDIGKIIKYKYNNKNRCYAHCPD